MNKKKLISLYDKSKFKETGKLESDQTRRKMANGKNGLRNSSYLEINNLRNKYSKGTFQNVSLQKNLMKRSSRHCRTKSEKF